MEGGNGKDVNYPADVINEIRRVDAFRDTLQNKDKVIKKVREHLNKKYVKEKVRSPSLINRFTHTRNNSKSSVKYLSMGRQTQVEDAANPYTIPIGGDLTQAPFVRSFKCLNDLIKPKTFESRNKPKEISTRLKTQEVVMSPGKVDLDPEYFTLVQYEPYREVFLRRQFTEAHRKCYFRKICAHLLHDEVVKKAEEHNLDLWRLNNVREEVDLIIQTFERYLADDHHESVAMMEEMTVINRLKESKLDELERCKRVITVIKSNIYALEDVLAYRMYCKDVLLKLSPVAWQDEFQTKVRQTAASFKKRSDGVAKNYEEFCRYNPEEIFDEPFDRIIKKFIENLLVIGPALMNFKHPNEIDQVFNCLERKRSEQIKHIEDAQGALNSFMTQLTTEQNNFQSEFNSVLGTISDQLSSITFQNVRAVELEKMAKSTIKTYYKWVMMGDGVLELMALIQGLYLDVVGESDTNMSYSEMMEQIHSTIKQTENQIRSMNKVYLQKMAKTSEKEQQRTMAAAEAARTKDRYIKGTIRRYASLLNPPAHHPGWRRPVPRSNPPPLRKRRAEQMSRSKDEFAREEANREDWLDFCKIEDSSTDPSSEEDDEECSTESYELYLGEEDC